jgi:hypothetical protein
MDAEFEEVARQRQDHLRYFVWLPFLRTADMWPRPRTELLDLETHWWEFRQHERESWFALFCAGLNLFYLVAALPGWLVSRLGIAGAFVVTSSAAVVLSQLAAKSRTTLRAGMLSGGACACRRSVQAGQSKT